MRATRTRNPLAVALMLAFMPALAQQPAPTTPPATTAAAAPAATKPFSQQDLDTILAPIALYPDPLLAQIFMASTYPLQVVEAARWQKANPTLKDKALEDALVKQTWDPAVKSLTTVPQVLTQMNEKIDWTQKLGDAFLADQKAVMQTVQSLRKKASDAGNLKSTDQQKVTTANEGGATIIKVEPTKPEVVYVPTYNPATIYGTWWYPAYPPYYMYPPGYVYAPGLAFATGVVVGAAIWGNCNWGGNDININTNNYNNFNKTNISNTNNKFQHNAENRKGVPYKDQGTAQKYNRGGDQKAAQSREQFRGRAEQGRSEMGSMDRSQLGGGAGDRSGSGNFGGGDRGGAAASANTRDMGSRGSASGGGSGSRDFGGGGGSASSRGSHSGFSNSGGGASTRAASSRGSASRGGGGGGGRGGGGRR
ncbi:DUF3300 domain-containing protein [Usitatibacter palustris]|uniref:DUF3300 domain-containing protein n=1 Tax=Usitatibacter palustris TaxID=2732487 RepID=A0A6M4HDY8_9PROT|nr:DUF3300 domain-containing protein [Usitatibacter palustris]QJR16824.1 hypothetical protein DSM104440_03660 [Usitatibacter palustris]